MRFTSHHNRLVLLAIGTAFAFALTARTVLANYPAAVMADKPLAYWRFNVEAGATTIPNLGSLGGAAHGTVVGDVQFVGGPDVVGLEFDNGAISVGAADSYVDSNLAFLQNRSEFTISLWMAPNARAGNRIGLVGQNDTLEFGFINPQRIQMWSPGGGNVTLDYPNEPEFADGEWVHIAAVGDGSNIHVYLNGELAVGGTGGGATNNYGPISTFDVSIGGGGIYDAPDVNGGNQFDGLMDEVAIFDFALSPDQIADQFDASDVSFNPFVINGGGQTHFENFDDMGTGIRLRAGWSGVTESGIRKRADGLGLTDGFLTVPGSEDDGVLGVLNLGGNSNSFGPAPDGFVPTWSAELGGANNLYGRDDAIADNATDRALGVSRENNDNAGELNFEVEIADGNLRAFVLDWDLEVWGGDPDTNFRSPEGPGMKVDVSVGGNSYDTMTENLLPGALFDSTEDAGSDHNATLIDGNVHSIRGITTGVKEVSAADGAVGNKVQINFNSNWNGVTDGDANGWISAVDNVRFRALAPGDADANGVVNVTDLLALLGGQKFNQGVAGVTWEQGDFNADDQFDTGDLLAMLSFLSGTFPSDPYASEAGGASDAVADIIVNSETGEVTVDLAGHTVSAVIIESASEIFNGQQPAWDTTSQFPSTLPGELGNVLFTSTAAGVDELGAVISAEFLGRDKEFYLQDLDLNILIASEGGALTKGNVIVVPEPSTWLILGLGSLLLVGWRQAKRSPGKN